MIFGRPFLDHSVNSTSFAKLPVNFVIVKRKFFENLIVFYSFENESFKY